jgi:hypothetical protein
MIVPREENETAMDVLLRRRGKFWRRKEKTDKKIFVKDYIDETKG